MQWKGIGSPIKNLNTVHYNPLHHPDFIAIIHNICVYISKTKITPKQKKWFVFMCKCFVIAELCSSCLDLLKTDS